ncbi:TetR/AcrR family transcriptional regulator [Mycobacterium spongiae]|uniref:TetR family transcriptional regulator n=1 Tax=Mycobacterium spongiae TaxID=886343 RepID=A0A975JZ31_9MYCO|nr:TetR family transcriptional regulator [Mycobacterium spongiae]QUR68357.1 TetR family transcriptional regulator [Mycobacterium spongiae]
MGIALRLSPVHDERNPESKPWRADPQAANYDQARTDILRAAERVMNQVGIAGLRIGQVAAEADCTRQNVHRYFATRRDLVEAVLVHRSARLSATIRQRVAAQARPLDRLVEGIIAATDIAAGDHHLRSYYSGASADQMLRFITSSPALRDQVAAPIEAFADEIGVRDDAAMSVPELTEWFFRIFVSELVWALTTQQSIEERRRNLRVLMASPLAAASQSAILRGG